MSTPIASGNWRRKGDPGRSTDVQRTRARAGFAKETGCARNRLREKPVARPLPIQRLWLPTYAAWLNPIEKLWRGLKQEVMHLHRLADAFDALKGHVASFWERFDEELPALLRYTGR
jgi:hypothetical protein